MVAVKVLKIRNHEESDGKGKPLTKWRLKYVGLFKGFGNLNKVAILGAEYVVTNRVARGNVLEIRVSLPHDDSTL